MLTAVGAGPPVLINTSTPVDPNETALLVGEGFDEGCEIKVGRLADAPCSEPVKKPASLPADSRACKAIQPSGQSIKVVIPADLAPGIFACRVSNASGETTLLLNVPEAWWVQGDGGTTASPGGWLRVQGKCLAIPQATATILLAGPKEVRLPASGNGYSIRAALPADLPPGKYEMRTHNGCGGDAAWSEPLTLEIAPPNKWPQLTVNVRELGAEGDGATDDTAAIKGRPEAACGERWRRVVLPSRPLPGQRDVDHTLSTRCFVASAGSCACWHGPTVTNRSPTSSWPPTASHWRNSPSA